MAQQNMNRPPQTQQAQQPDPLQLVKDMLQERLKDIEAALPPILKPQAKDFVRLALVDLPRQRALLDVAVRSPARILIALMDIARMGLFPGSKLGEAYVVPFKNKGAWDCQAIIGYRGFLKLARRSGEIADIRARVVMKEDAFDIEFGTAERIVHKPALTVDRGDPDGMIGIYVVAEFKGGGNHVEWMSASEIWQLAKRSATYSHDQGVHTTGPWLTDYVEMAKKTVARRGSKWWPLTVDAAEAIGRDEEREIVVEADEGRTLALPSATSGFRVFDSGRFAYPEPEPEPMPQQQAPQQQPAPQQQQTTAGAAGHAWETQPPDKPRRAAPQQQQGQGRRQAPQQTAPSVAPSQQQQAPPITAEEAAEILRREQEEAAAAERGVGD